jgi:RNA polymerase sigma-70 factor (ECF subfamily)
MAEEASFRDLLRRVRAGDQEAARELVRQYEPEIRRSVRGPLAGLKLRHIIDSMDICQAVLANFFVRIGEGEFELQYPEQLLKLFVTMARNRLRDEARRQRAGRRDHRRQAADLSQHCLDGLFDDAPTPSRIASTRELLDEVQRRLPAEERELLEQRGLGRQWNELAQERSATPVALRKKLTRALARVVEELGLQAQPGDP